jgi:hypothetical protein
MLLSLECGNDCNSIVDVGHCENVYVLYGYVLAEGNFEVFAFLFFTVRLRKFLLSSS